MHIETKTQVETAPRMPSPAAVQQLMMRWGAEKMRVSGTLAALRAGAAAEHVEKDGTGAAAEHVEKDETGAAAEHVEKKSKK